MIGEGGLTSTDPEGLSIGTIKRVALVVTTITNFAIPFMGSAMYIALPTIGTEFKVNAVLLSWVAMSFTLATAMLLVPLSKLGDIYGRKKLFTYGMALFTIASSLCAMAPSVPMLILFRFIQGIGGAMCFGTAMAILISVFPPGERGSAMGINTAAVYLGLSLGPFIGGFLTQYLGWRSIFVTAVPFGLLIVTLTLVKLKGEWAEARGERFDLGGSAIYCVALVALIVGFSLLPGVKGGIAILLSLIGMYVFVRWEAKTENPVVNLSLFKTNRVFALSNIAGLINYSATFAIGFVLSLYLQYVRGMSPQAAGFVLVAQPIVQAVVSPWSGRLADRVEPRIVATMGMGICAIGLFLLSIIDETTSLYVIVAKLALLGFGFALFSTPNTTAVMNSVDKQFYGVASGIQATMRSVGQAMSLGIAVLVLAVYMGRVRITPQYFPLFLKSVHATFLIFGTFCVAGVFASIARGKTR
jgi:EmrB/QacA subfamily drug resistance transporter